MSCSCNDYDHLELIRKDISKRIRETRKLKKSLEEIAKDSSGEHKLFICPKCSQHWQMSRAWNWANEPYLFKVPQITIDDWLQELYIQPDSMLIFDAVITRFLDQDFVDSTRTCKTENCDKKAIKVSAFCLSHHIAMLQEAKMLPKIPEGRMFKPYDYSKDVVSLSDL